MAMKRITHAAVLMALALGAAQWSAAAEERNPLHPTYYMKRAEAIVGPYVGTGASELYVDRHNPRHPAHYAGTAGAWEQAAHEPTEPYVDRHNPRDPRYAR